MPERHARAARRAPALAVVAAVLVSGGLIDRSAGRHVSPTVTAQAVQPVPVAAPAGAFSSSWFCAGATDAKPDNAPGRVVIANEGSGPVTGRVTVVTSSGASPSSSQITVAPGAQSTVPETVPRGAPWTGAIVDVDGGRVAVSQVVDGSLGRAVSPCATSGSRHWYLPAGETRVNASDTVLLLNPYPTDSIVDLSFATDQGSEAPQEFQGLDVPPNGLVAVDLGSHLRRRQSIATTVSARTGNVVAWDAELVTPPPKGAPLVGTPAANAPVADPALPDPGLSVTLGAPSAGDTWAFPDGLAGNGIDEQYLVYNPGVETAQVRLSLGLQEGTAEPIDISVGPGQETSIVSETQPRIPSGMAHTATLVSTNGVPVVAVRTVAASKVSVGPSNRSGIGEMLGERVSATRWLVPATASAPDHTGQVIVENPGPRSTQVVLSGGGSNSTVTVPAAGRAALSVPSGSSGPLVVSADGLVYVEYDLYGKAATSGFSLSTAVPLG
jgi:hypothetical protein